MYNRIPVMFAVVILPVILSLGLFFAFTEKKNNLRYFNGSTRPVNNIRTARYSFDVSFIKSCQLNSNFFSHLVID